MMRPEFKRIIHVIFVFIRADILYLERLNAMQPQKRFYDEDYGEVISGPVEKRGGNEAINRIISRLRPTYSKRPRERYVRCKYISMFIIVF